MVSLILFIIDNCCGLINITYNNCYNYCFKSTVKIFTIELNL